jgi:uncharacterized protein (TIGR03663 family)
MPAPVPVAAPEAVSAGVLTLREMLNLATVEVVAYAALALVAFWMRFLALDARPLSAAEAGDALAALNLVRGQAVGAFTSPLVVSLNAVLFFLVGASDYAARVVPALFGVALALVPALFRRELGRNGALIAALLLSFSPALMWFGRDVSGAGIAAVCALGAMGLGWRVLTGDAPGRSLYLAAGLAALALSADAGVFTILLAGALFFGIRALVARTRGVPENARGETADEPVRQNPAFTVEPNIARTALIIFVGVFLAAATTLFTNRLGLGAAFNLFDTWLRGWQLGGDFGDPLRLLLVYEPLTLVFGLAGATLLFTWREASGTRTFFAFLAAWAGIAIVFHTLSAVKHPENVVVMVVPLALLAGWFLGNLIERARDEITADGNGLKDALWQEVPLGLLLLFLSGYAYLQFATRLQTGTLPLAQAILTILRITPQEGSNADFIILAVMIVIALAIIGFFAWTLIGTARAANLVALVVALLLGVATVRALWLLNFSPAMNGGEWLSATQSTPQIRDLVSDLKNVSRWRANDSSLIKTAVDDSLGPLIGWYLRDFTNVRYTREAASAKEVQALVLPEGVKPRVGNWQGQQYRVEQVWDGHGLAGADLIKWLLFHEGGQMTWRKAELWILPPPQAQ